jgi:hypothetical protein
MIEDFKKIENLVEKILREEPRARDDDAYLIFRVWDYQGFPVPEDVRNKIISFACSSESVRRVRQKIQEAGKYRGPSYRMRQEESGNVRRWANRDDLFNKEDEYGTN